MHPVRVRSFALCMRGHGGHIASEAFRVRSHGLALLFWTARLIAGPTMLVVTSVNPVCASFPSCG
ncbi:hypothetical protein AQ611_07815 [Burkholderia singularis]|nr:hypothetical protein AQ611_07815 [Burkholderia sp. Bp7605]